MCIRDSYRNAHTVEAHSPDLAAYVWGRIRDQVVPLVEFTTGQGRWERGTEGQWRACGVLHLYRLRPLLGRGKY